MIIRDVILSGVRRSEARMIGHARESNGVEGSHAASLSGELHEILRFALNDGFIL